MANGSYYNSFYLIFIPLLPLLGAMINGFFGAVIQTKLDKFYIHFVAIATVVTSFVLSLAGFIKLAADDSVLAIYTNAWTFLSIGSLKVDVAFILDPLSAVMCLVITFVGSLIHIYSTGYMKDDEGYWRFFAYLNLFMFSMLVLVLADNFLVMFIGWEGVGLCSYLLIGFWYKDVNNAKAGVKAFIVNRIGDVGFVIGIFILFWTLASISSGSGAVYTPGSAIHAPNSYASLVFADIEKTLQDVSIRQVFVAKTLFNIPAVTLICIALFIGAMGKSAQIPLYVWLPDAMAGPTPVSALIHAATMVTAGVYMVARLHFLFALSPFAMTWVALFGAVTALFAATIGFFQYDIKKVLAYSTISQLGFMFIGVGVGAYSAGIFHLVTHAFFKACLFLCAGSVIIGCHHEQDMRKMGGLSLYMPKTNLAYLIACIAISGFPFFSGFFSKDDILYRAFINQNMVYPGMGILIWGIGMAAALCTAYYIFRSYFMTFTGVFRGDPANLPKESPKSITHVLLLLAFFSAIVGFSDMPEIFYMPNLFHHFLEPVFESSRGLLHFSRGSHALEWLLTGLSVMLAFLGAYAAFYLYKDAESRLPTRLLSFESKPVRWVYRLIYNKYYIDELYHITMVKLVMAIRLIFNWIDQHIIDALVNFAGFAGKLVGTVAGTADSKGVDGMVNATANTVFTAGANLIKIQTGRLRHYLGVALAGGVILVIVNYIFFN
ncbi:MAG: NADH-quinone oxidoreductase subunit L [Deltaproteobacteria bacterium]|nr:NADH-quinone oxidoreductase subunit L [Deltaproteobacteria bacterium]